MAAHPPLRLADEEAEFDDGRARAGTACAARRSRTGCSAPTTGASRATATSRPATRAADCFWLLRYGVPFGAATVRDLVLVGPQRRGRRRQRQRPGPRSTSPPTTSIGRSTRPGPRWCARHTRTRRTAHRGRPTPSRSSRSCRRRPRSTVPHRLRRRGRQRQSTDGGKRIAGALGDGRGVILRNHGLLTVGGTVDEAIGWFIMMERVAEVHVKAHRPQRDQRRAAARRAQQ